MKRKRKKEDFFSLFHFDAAPPSPLPFLFLSNEVLGQGGTGPGGSMATLRGDPMASRRRPVHRISPFGMFAPPLLVL